MPPEQISSPHNPRIKQAAKLREGRQRQKQGRFLIDGARELLRALDSGVELDEVFICAEQCVTAECRAAYERLESLPMRMTHVTSALMERLSFGGRSEGLLAVATPPKRALDQLQMQSHPLVAVLEGVEKPGNVGAVLRSADAAGVDALIVADGGTDLYNPNAIRASMGTIFTVPVCTASSEETLACLSGRGWRIYAARVEADRLYTEVDWREPAAIVLGSEAFGLSAAWSGANVIGVRLPMCGAADSLNVSAAAAVIFYEALRQRNLADGRR